MAEPMTEAEARERLVNGARHNQAALFYNGAVLAVPEELASTAVDAILATTDALAVLLDPETMLRAWEKAGRVAPGIIGDWWRIVPDEEGARDG